MIVMLITEGSNFEKASSPKS